jgi:hypothetical protein
MHREKNLGEVFILAGDLDAELLLQSDADFERVDRIQAETAAGIGAIK